MIYRSNVLSLYKGKYFQVLSADIKYWAISFQDLLKYGKTLKFTDKEFYKKRVKQEFANNKNLEEKDIPFVIKQGRAFLMNQNVL